MGGCHSGRVEPARCRARERLTVLVAVQFGEDTSVGQIFLAKFLKKNFSRWNILFAGSLWEAVHRCQQQRIDILFLSEVFHDRDHLTGPEAARLIRQAEPNPCCQKPQNWLPTVIVMVEGVDLTWLGSRAASRTSRHSRLQSNGSHDINFCVMMLYMDYSEGGLLCSQLRSCIGCDACFACCSPAHLCPCMWDHRALHRRAQLAAASELDSTRGATPASAGDADQVAHSVWQNCDMVTLFLRQTHPEIGDSATNLTGVNKLYRKCFQMAVRQNVAETLLPLLRLVKSNVSEVDVSRLLSAYIFDKKIPSQHLISTGQVTYSVRYIVEGLAEGDRGEHFDDHTHRMAEQLLEALDLLPVEVDDELPRVSMSAGARVLLRLRAWVRGVLRPTWFGAHERRLAY